jgi:uncharacterized protein YfaS (alpha-2-macroglobulin family)
MTWADRKGNVLSADAPVPQGTEIVATITVNPAVTLNDLVVSCLLPAGLEIEDKLYVGNQESGSAKDSASGALIRADVRDDRLRLFMDRVTGETSYSFTLRAVTQGSFSLPPLAAEGMYNPGIHFVGPSGRLTVSAADLAE